MKKIVVTATATLFLLGALMGCDAKEREALQNKVTSLEQQLSKANSDLAAKESELGQLQSQLKASEDAQAQARSQIASLNSELAQVRGELAKLKASRAAPAKKSVKKKK